MLGVVSCAASGVGTPAKSNRTARQAADCKTEDEELKTDDDFETAGKFNTEGEPQARCVEGVRRSWWCGNSIEMASSRVILSGPRPCASAAPTHHKAGATAKHPDEIFDQICEEWKIPNSTIAYGS